MWGFFLIVQLVANGSGALSPLIAHFAIFFRTLTRSALSSNFPFSHRIHAGHLPDIAIPWLINSLFRSQLAAERSDFIFDSSCARIMTMIEPSRSAGLSLTDFDV